MIVMKSVAAKTFLFKCRLYRHWNRFFFSLSRSKFDRGELSISTYRASWPNASTCQCKHEKKPRLDQIVPLKVYYLIFNIWKCYRSDEPTLFDTTAGRQSYPGNEADGPDGPGHVTHYSVFLYRPRNYFTTASSFSGLGGRSYTSLSGLRVSPTASD